MKKKYSRRTDKTANLASPNNKDFMASKNTIALYHGVMLYASFILFLIHTASPFLHSRYYIPLISDENLGLQVISFIAVVALILVLVRSYSFKPMAEEREKIFILQHCTWIFTQLLKIASVSILALGGAWLIDFVLGWLSGTNDEFFLDLVTRYYEFFVPPYICGYSMWANFRFIRNKGIDTKEEEEEED